NLGQSLNEGTNSGKITGIIHNDALLVVVMKIYVIKIAVRSVSPMVWHQLRIVADTSLASRHSC
ncbi:hypothetical protein DNC81_23060, partial [Shigella sonnei]|nr:hypothetical protein [Shigella sonnei]